jgi:hypothetical protein
MTSLAKFAAVAALGAGALVLTAGSASARIICDNDGDCWHVKDVYTYPPTAGVIIHEDDWTWGDADHDRYRWREHEGRGYWQGGVWVTF